MKTKVLVRKSIALAITAAIVGVTPGLEFYRAAAAGPVSVGTPVEVGVGAAPVVGAAGFQNAGMPGSVGNASTPGNLRGGLRGRIGFKRLSIPSPSPLPGGERRVPTAAGDSSDPLPVGERTAAFKSLIEETPDTARLEANEASSAVEKDFYRKIGQTFRGYAESLPRAYNGVRGVAKASKNSKARMPERHQDLNGDAPAKSSVPDPDGSLIQRRQDDGPDSVSDEFNQGGGGRGAVLFSIAAAALLLPASAMAAGVVLPAVVPAAAGAVSFLGSVLFSVPGILLGSAVLHELAHGVVAHAMGDETAKKAGRLTLNPFKHVHWGYTVLMPLVLIGAQLPPVLMAKPMPYNDANFKNPVLGRALMAAAGPLLNIGLALAGIGVFHGLAAMLPLVGPGIVNAMYIAIRANLVLAMFNAVFFVPGFDGANVLRAFLPQGGRDFMDSIERHLERRWVSRVAVLTALSLSVLPFVIAPASGLLTHWMLGMFTVQVAPAATVQAASVLPVVLGLSLVKPMAFSRVLTMPEQPYRVIAPEAVAAADRVKVMVRIPQPVRWKSDFHVDWVDWSQPDAFEKYQTSVMAMVAQLERAGISAETLQKFDAVPTATYATLARAATLSVPAGQKAALEDALRAQGLSVEDPREHKLAVMDPTEANAPDKPQSKTVALKDVVRITGADKVQEILKKELENAVDPARLNVPAFLKPATLWVMRRLGMLKAPVNPAGSIIDTGNDPAHPMLKGRYTRDAKDGHGHGTWVGSAVTSFDPQQKNLRSYNTFKNGSATTDDILRDLTQAFKDGAEWFTNSWGDSWGDPSSLEGQAVRKIAEDGRVQFFAAGNQGSDDNTVGGPAIAYFQDPKTGAMMIVSVGATDSDRLTAWFQSRGPWSPFVKENESKFPGYPVRVDIQSVGHKVYGAYPTYMRGADKVDPELGPQKESSGTSMSTPTMGGAYSLLREFGFQPAAIVKALLETADKSGLPEAEGGKGFVNVFAAYQSLKKAQDAGPSARLKRTLAFDRVSVFRQATEQAEPAKPKGGIGVKGLYSVAALALPLLAFATPAFAAAMAAVGHPVLSVVGGVALGFVGGAAIGTYATRDFMKGPDPGPMIGLVLLMRLGVIALFALGGSVVGAIAGAVLGA